MKLDEEAGGHFDYASGMLCSQNPLYGEGERAEQGVNSLLIHLYAWHHIYIYLKSTQHATPYD